MRDFNLSAWALRHRSLVAFLMVALLVAGVLAHFRLGRAEDPDFTFKIMVVQAFWPGADAPQVALQVTEKLEKKLQEVPYLKLLRSSSKPGESLIFVELQDYTPPREVPNAWYQVRKKLGDVRHTLPEGVRGPFFNDEFGDTFGLIYALHGQGFDNAALRREAERLVREIRRVPDVGKLELIGVQDEKIYVEMSSVKLATLGLDPLLVARSLQEQNAMTPSGVVEGDDARVFLRVSGEFVDLDGIRGIGIHANGRTIRLGDIARIHRGTVDPPAPMFRWQGREAVGIAVSMARGGDVLRLGENLDRAIERLRQDIPVGMALESVADQPRVVARSIDEFMKVLAEAVVIVLAVSFLSLGWRTGTVVALSIPLVLAVTFLLMQVFGIALQRISLGALIIALGLLVDDAIIAVEMMVVKIEQGWDKFEAATFAYTSTAFPMLTGTLITAAGFLPVGFAKSAAGEYTFSIFAVVTIALLVSWVVAVVFTPFIGSALLNVERLRAAAAKHGADLYDTPFYRRFRRLVAGCVAHPWRVIALALASFALAIAAFAGGVEKQFFPSSNRPELLVDLRLPEWSSIHASAAAAARMSRYLSEDPALKPEIEHFVSYVGSGSARFYLPLDQQLPADNFAQFVVMTRGIEARERARARLLELFEQDFPGLQGRVRRLENGPPVGYPVVFRVSGEDPAVLRAAAARIAAELRAHPELGGVNYDWNELSRRTRLVVDQDKARALGVSSASLAASVNALVSGLPLTALREGDQLIEIVGRAEPAERAGLSTLAGLNVHTRDGRSVPLAQLARFEAGLEEGIIWRRNRLPTISVRADIVGKAQAPTISKALDPRFDALRAELAARHGPSYRVEMGGTAEESGRAERSIQAVMPMMLVVVLLLLMVQLQSFSRMTMVVLTAPFGIIGVTLSLLAFQAPFGFVAQLGVIALAGMIMRNSVILVDQIERDLAEGKALAEAIVDSTVRRFRPIVLTAMAAVLAMIPLSRSLFWGPMAIAIMGGLIVATLLTLLVLPAIYSAWMGRVGSAA